MKFLDILPFFISSGYILFMLSGRSLNPKTFRYNKLVNSDYFYKQLFFSLLLSFVALFFFKRINSFSLFFTPIIFIICFKLINPLFIKHYNRNIYISTRHDFKPKNHTIYDGIVGFLIVLVSIMLPLIIIIKLNSH